MATTLVLRKLARVKSEAKKLGAAYRKDVNGRTVTVAVEAPAGKVWAATGDVHELFTEWRVGEPADWQVEALVDLLDRMSYGLCECNDADCEWCHPE